MTLPKTMYHGTTLARWEIGIKYEGLKGDMPRHLKVDNKHKGHVYLCDNIQDSAFYALLTYAFDMHTNNKILNQVAPTSLIIAVRTSQIRHLIEPDPEQEEVRAEYKKQLHANAFNFSQKMYMNGKWYRIKDNIPTKYLTAYKMIPTDAQDPFTMKLVKAMADDKMIEEKLRNFVEKHDINSPEELKQKIKQERP
jgi:hypothetical protein